MKQANEINYLFRKFLADDYTVDDFCKLQEHFRSDGDEDVIKSLILQAMTNGNELDYVADADLNAVLEDVDTRLEHRLFRPNRRKTGEWRRWFPYAAAVLIVMLSGIVFYSVDFTEPKNPHLLNGAINPQPGTYQATLTLADGTAVELNNAQSEVIMGDQPMYTDGSNVLTNDQVLQASQPLTLATPNGGMYRLTLHDGTTVWLNSASTLVYPSRFDEDERVVHLTGEAYFAVEPLAHGGSAVPFKVVAGDQTIHVLGTEFNVNAYTGKEEVKTTLVTGSVEIAVGHAVVGQLTPGQQATFRGNELQVFDVDTRPFTSWKDGVFYFDRTPLVDAMEAMARWYDVEVRYEGPAPRTLFYGEIGRDKPLSDVLGVLEEGGVSFRLELLQGKPVLVVAEVDKSVSKEKEVFMMK